MFNLERGIIFTLLELLKNPGNVVRAFVSGNRLQYFNPFRLMLVAATLAVLTESITGTIESVGVLKIEGEEHAINQVISDYLRNNMNLIILGTVPFLSIGSYFAFKRHRWNFAEHLVVNAYGYSIPAIVGSFYSLSIALVPIEQRIYLEGLSQLLMFYVAYLYISTWQIHWLRGIFAFILSFFISIISIMIIAIIIGVSLKLFN